MKTITIDDKLYAHIASQTKYIGESASDILRRLLLPESDVQAVEPTPEQVPEGAIKAPVADAPESSGEFVIDQDAILGCSTVVERFLLVLSQLHAANPSSFVKVLDIKGKGRDYFAESKEHLLATGSSTNPKAVPGSIYWVVTNNNTSKKASILRQVSEVLGYDEAKQSEITHLLTVK